jgi:putative restriction endonuclease
MKSKRQLFSFYVHAFNNLRRDYKKGGAPHKPILLLSIIQLFEKNLITSSKIYITPELVGYFKSTWNALVKTSHDLRFALPFYHLSSEPFWKLIPNNGCEKWIEAKSSMRSFSNLNTAVAYAEIDNELFELLKQKDSREILKITLLEKYFSESKSNFGGNDGGKYLNNLSNEIIEEEAEEYRKRIHELKKELGEESYQEEIYLRDGVFKREIPRIYNYTCCISGMRIDATVNVSMNDRCLPHNSF